MDPDPPSPNFVDPDPHTINMRIHMTGNITVYSIINIQSLTTSAFNMPLITVERVISNLKGRVPQIL